MLLHGSILLRKKTLTKMLLLHADAALQAIDCRQQQNNAGLNYESQAKWVTVPNAHNSAHIMYLTIATNARQQVGLVLRGSVFVSRVHLGEACTRSMNAS